MKKIKESKFERATRVRESENGRRFTERTIPNKKKISRWEASGFDGE